MRGFCLEVSGAFACFTRPEMKVERVSYDVITPSAARGIFESILWKPAIRWRINQIRVLSPIHWVSIRRNEVGKVASSRSTGLFIEDERQQRAGLLLRNVIYRIQAQFDFIPPEKRCAEENPAPEWLIDQQEQPQGADQDLRQDETEAKYAAMFERRALKGQCFNQPYLGCREFPAAFRLVRPDEATPAVPRELAGKRDLGWMLYDLDYADSENTRPMFFRASMQDGVIAVPDPDNREEVRG